MANPSQEVLDLEPFVQQLQAQIASLEAQLAEASLSPEARAALDRLTAMAASHSASAPSAG